MTTGTGCEQVSVGNAHPGQSSWSILVAQKKGNKNRAQCSENIAVDAGWRGDGMCNTCHACGTRDATWQGLLQERNSSAGYRPLDGGGRRRAGRDNCRRHGR